jgi:hypothetical protein
MIHHVSISARDPKHVAGVLAELMQGRTYPFPGRAVDSFMAVSGDENGTMIEVYPSNVTLMPGQEDRQVRFGDSPSPEYGPFHLLLSVPADRVTVERIGAREGWRTRHFPRGAPGQPPAFHVIEVWVENRLMIEVVTPEMVADYTRQIRFDNLDAHAKRTAAA